MEEHNNMLEGRTAVMAAERVSRKPSNWGRRCLMISDSQAVIGAFAKGRSSVQRFNALCRRMAAVTLGMGIRFYWRYVRTHRNVADGPSRGQALGYAGTLPDLPQNASSPDLAQVFYLKTQG